MASLLTPALLLNASYEPLRVIDWKEAVTMVYVGKAEVLAEHDRVLRSVNVSMKAPAVVRLMKYISIGRRFPSLSRNNLLARDGYGCAYCGKPLTIKDVTLDHVIPRCRGGKTTWENLVVACVMCNDKKGSRTVSASGMRLLKIPHRPNWLPILNIKLKDDAPACWEKFLISD